MIITRMFAESNTQGFFVIIAKFRKIAFKVLAWLDYIPKILVDML